MKIALIAHDKKKEDMIRFVTAYKDIFEQHELYATGTTGTRIMRRGFFNGSSFPFWSSWRRPRNWGDDCTR